MNRLIGGILLVAGTTVGAGMLALPVVSGMAGFFPSMLLLFFYWAFMAYTAFLLLEVNLWFSPHTNLISMARHTLGIKGEVVSWLVYLFLLYALSTAYIFSSASSVIDVVSALTGQTPHLLWGTIPLVTVFAYFVYRGTQSVDRFNRLLMLALVVLYLILILWVTPQIEPHNLMQVGWPYLFLPLSLVATSYGFHIVIPSLVDYFNRDVLLLRRALLIGTSIPLIVYILWQLIALGTLPLPTIITGFSEGAEAGKLMGMTLGQRPIALIARFFSFFAVLTSFLGVSLSLSDFLSDGLRIKKTQEGKAALCLLTFLPPMVIMFTSKRIFFVALSYAGAFGVIVLLALLPALMAWSGRYTHQYLGGYRAPGGRGALAGVVLLSLILIGLEVAQTAGWIVFPVMTGGNG